MRITRGLRPLIGAFAGLLLPVAAWGEYQALPGRGPVAPAPESEASSAEFVELLEPPPPRGYRDDIRKLK